jgi:hypothetical protein
MQTHDLGQPDTSPLGPASPRRHRRRALLGAGALALVLATIGITAALAGGSSPAARAHAPSVTVASPNVAAAPATVHRPRRGRAATKSATSGAVAVLADGTYPTYIDGVDVGGGTITIDVIQVFENDAATNAAIEDGMAPNDAQYLYVYVRNQNPRLRTLPVDREVDMLFLDGCEAPPERDAALTELAKRTTPFDSLYYYDVTVTNGTIHNIEQHLTEAAC